MTHPPSTKIFDRVNYYYPNSKKPLEDYNDNIPHNGKLILFM